MGEAGKFAIKSDGLWGIAPNGKWAIFNSAGNACDCCGTAGCPTVCDSFAFPRYRTTNINGSYSPKVSNWKKFYFDIDLSNIANITGITIFVEGTGTGEPDLLARFRGDSVADESYVEFQYRHALGVGGTWTTFASATIGDFAYIFGNPSPSTRQLSLEISRDDPSVGTSDEWTIKAIRENVEELSAAIPSGVILDVTKVCAGSLQLNTSGGFTFSYSGICGFAGESSIIPGLTGLYVYDGTVLEPMGDEVLTGDFSVEGCFQVDPGFDFTSGTNLSSSPNNHALISGQSSANPLTSGTFDVYYQHNSNRFVFNDDGTLIFGNVNGLAFEGVGFMRWQFYRTSGNVGLLVDGELVFFTANSNDFTLKQCGVRESALSVYNDHQVTVDSITV